MDFIIFLLVGALAGYLGGQLMGKANNLLVNIFVGIVGSVLGRLLFDNLLGGVFQDLPKLGPISIGSLVTAVLGSCILLWIIGFLQKK
ncbi:MAG: GlsB/YeaQ/YmgE family stress response membrane protein [Paludibacteraceae bacterium]|nr:GlsB/YeaQ/YmgE family stress response membrane protein [Paludibacteraceae bacterium]